MPSLYDALGLDASATQAEVKKAYHGLALRLHPDKNPGDESAHEKFQSLQRVYAVLGDPEKRKFYDETGVEAGDVGGLSGDQFDNLYKYYREVYAELTVDDIERYEQTYRGSAEEERELKELYTRFSGNMKQVFEWLCCSRPELDSHRFMVVLQRGVAAGELAKYKKFEQWAKLVAQKPAPLKPLEPTKRGGRAGKTGGDSSQALVAAIQGKGKHAAGFHDFLEAKYAGGKAKKRGEPSDEEFAAAQARTQSKQRTK